MTCRAVRRGGLGFAMLCAVSVAQGATWYVGPDGEGADSAGAGTSTGTPFATVAYGLSSATPGDIVTLMPGTHTQGGILDITKPLILQGTDRYTTKLLFPGSFTSFLNVGALQIKSSNVVIRTLSIERQNYISGGSVIALYGETWPSLQPKYDHVEVRDCDLIGGQFGLAMKAKNFTLANCAVYAQDADSDIQARSVGIFAFVGTVHIVSNYFEGWLAGNLGGVRVRRAFQIEPGEGRERAAGTLDISYNTIYGVREPFLWDNWVQPMTDKVTVNFVHNTVDNTAKTPFTMFAYNIVNATNEHLKFDSIVVRDNVFANTGGSAIGRSDYQVAGFPSNFPVGGFTFENNLLFLRPEVAAVDSLGSPAAPEAGWSSGAEFDTTGQPAALRFDATTAPSPFADPAHGGRNFALDPSKAAGLAGIMTATDGQTIGAWQLPELQAVSGNSIALSWDTASNLTYQVQQAAPGAPDGWEELGAPVPGDGVPHHLVDPAAETAKWYRVGLVY